jgi:hypothetical protein
LSSFKVKNGILLKNWSKTIPGEVTGVLVITVKEVLGHILGITFIAVSKLLLVGPLDWPFVSLPRDLIGRSFDLAHTRNRTSI